MGTTAVAAAFDHPSVYPLHRCKILHVVRHGQGYHNVAGTVDPKSYESWDFEDASLTERGWRQAEALRAHVAATHIRNHVELVVVSPLLRTLQTAAGVWGGATLRHGEAPASALMRPGVGRFRHPPISSAGAPPFVANEWCREQSGVHPCDKRSSITTYKRSFPAIDFSQVETDEDTWWQAARRETPDEIWARGRVFLKWILARTERRIAVVSHSSFLHHLVHLLHGGGRSAGFRNCEMQSFALCDRGATGATVGVNTDFKGGLFFDDDQVVVAARSSSPLPEELFDSELAWFDEDHLPNTAPRIPKHSRKRPSRPSPRNPLRKQSRSDLEDSENEEGDSL